MDDPGRATNGSTPPTEAAPESADAQPESAEEPAGIDQHPADTPSAMDQHPAADPPAVATSDDRDAALVLAGLHLRLGSLALARAELETLAAAGHLDRTGRVDLAEVRWRTGDLLAAGAAARESLAAGDTSVIALVVAAEAAAALGRPTESRKLATQAQASLDGSIDPVFAGMPRSGVWPADPAEPVPSPTTLFPVDRATPGNGLSSEATGRAGARGRSGVGGATAAAVAAALANGATTADAHPAGEAAVAGAAMSHPAGPDHGPGFWDDLPEAETAPPEAPPAADIAMPRDPSPPDGLDLAAVLDAGEAALSAGDYATAALHLGLIVRVAPAIAPAVLAAIGETPDAGLQMVRGDAYRVLGREVDARRAYEMAMTAAAQAEGRPGASDQTAVLGTTIPIDRWDPSSWAPLPTPESPPAGAEFDDVEPPPFLLSRPWPGLAKDRPASPEPDPHRGEDRPSAVDDDDSDPFAGEP